MGLGLRVMSFGGLGFRVRSLGVHGLGVQGLGLCSMSPKPTLDTLHSHFSYVARAGGRLSSEFEGCLDPTPLL